MTSQHQWDHQARLQNDRFVRREYESTARDARSNHTSNTAHIDSRTHHAHHVDFVSPNYNGQPVVDATSEHTTLSVQGSTSRHQSKGKVAQSWVPEILGAILAIGLHVAIFTILGAFNDKHTSSWPGPINLSALVATLSTISRISLGAIVNEVISQTKWSWLGRSNGVPLNDLEVFDQASRGPFGAALLLKKSLRKPYLLITLFVALTSIAMGPFTQQAVLTVQCTYEDAAEKATIPSLRTMGNLGIKLHSSMPSAANPNFTIAGSLDRGTKAGILSSILAPYEDSKVLPTCTTGNCTFRELQDTDGKRFTHRSTGFCSLCHDISSTVAYSTWNETTLDARGARNITIQHFRWTLPGGPELSYDSESLKIEYQFNEMAFLNISAKHSSPSSSLSPFLPNVAQGNASHKGLVDLTFLSLDAIEKAGNHSLDKLRNPSASATICTLYPCLRTYLASIADGRMNESIVSTEPLISYHDMLYEPIANNSADVTNSGKGLFTPNTDAILVRPPCIVGDKVITSENITSANDTVTLTKWTRELTADEKSFIELSPGGMNNLTVNITAPRECLYAMDVHGWWGNLGQLLQDQLQGVCYSVRYGSDNANCIKGATPSKPTGAEAMWLEGFASLARRSAPELSDYMARVAESMTDKFRMKTARPFGQTNPGNEWRAESEAVVGRVVQTTTCFRVDWRWLTFSTGLTAMTVGILIWMVVSGMLRGDIVWKGSSLPVVFYRDRMEVVKGSRGLGAPESEPLMGVGEMRGRAKEISVVFRG